MIGISEFSRGVTVQENRIAIYCDIFTLYCDILRYFHFLIFSVKLNKFHNIRLNFEPYVIFVIESELYTCIHDCMRTFYKGIQCDRYTSSGFAIATRQELHGK